jgi:hypothetical protein
MTRAQHISMTRQAHIRLNNELAAFRDAASIGSSDDDHMDTNELGDGYRARRTRIRRIAALLAEAIVDDDSAGDGTAEPGAPLSPSTTTTPVTPQRLSSVAAAPATPTTTSTRCDRRSAAR